MKYNVTDLSCPRCGGLFERSANQGGYESHKCKNCGYTVVVENEHSLEKLFALNAFRNEVIKLLKQKFDGGKKERIATWQRRKDEFERYLTQCDESVDGEPDPLYAMARAAYLTDGFGEYTDKEEKTTVEGLYRTALRYAEKNEKAGYVKELIWFYRKKLRNKRRNLLLGILGGLAAVLVGAGITAGVLLDGYAPALTHGETGITVRLSENAIPSLKKLSVDLKAEAQPSHSTAYIDAKNALHSQTEKFVLYDLSLTSGKGTLTLEAPVTVEFPIPDGYLPGALRVYYIDSASSFEEIPSTVSVATNTVSFTTDHFSLYALAERHPIVTFDTAGAGELPRQIILRDNLISAPADPVKEGHVFLGWFVGEERWDFETDTVKVDMTLTARWAPNAYTVSLVTDGDALSVDSLKIPFMGAFSELPTAPTKTGHTFLGWYTAKENGLLVTSESVLSSPADLTLYALFALNRYKVNLVASGVTLSEDTLTVPYMSALETLPETVEKKGHTFLGWYTAEENGNLVTKETVLSAPEDMTLYAHWSVNEYTLTFDTAGASPIPPHAYAYGETTELPAPPDRAGYVFLGWSYSREDFTLGLPMPDENITVTANWDFCSVSYNSGKNAITIDASYEKIHDTIDLSPLVPFMNENYILHFAVQVEMREIYSGLQEIYLCTANQAHVEGAYDDEYSYGGGGSANRTFSWVEFPWSVSGEKCTAMMHLSYGAHGESADDWERRHVRVTVTVSEKN